MKFSGGDRIMGGESARQSRPNPTLSEEDRRDMDRHALPSSPTCRQACFQSCPSETVLFMDLIIASGYPYPYRNTSEELAAANADNWFPATVDFRATAVHSGGAGEAATFDELLGVIAKKKQGSIRELGLVGHANQEAFVLAGRIDKGVITSNSKAIIRPDTIQDNLAKITAVRNRFATQDATPPSITLFACDVGSGDKLLEELSKAFQVTVRGFQREIWWCFMTGKGRAVRGRTWYDAVGAGLHPNCDSPQFSPDIRVWEPEKKSFAGNQIDL
jgi:hypothetical protein